MDLRHTSNRHNSKGITLVDQELLIACNKTAKLPLESALTMSYLIPW